MLTKRTQLFSDTREIAKWHSTGIKLKQHLNVVPKRDLAYTVHTVPEKNVTPCHFHIFAKY